MPFGNLISWDYFICLSCSFATATIRKTPTKIYLLILMSQSLMTSLTWRSTLFERCVFRVLPLSISQLMNLQSLVNAISQVRFENGKTPSVVRQFLVDQLRYNDNTANPVSPISSQIVAKLLISTLFSTRTRSTYAL